MKINFYIVFIVLSTCFALCAAGNDKELLSKTIEKYSSLTKGIHSGTISAYALKKEMTEKKEIVLVDVREKEEMEISKLPRAVTKEEFLKNTERYKGKKIVAYCTIGYRSGKFAEKHKDLNILNLEGGVLAWSHFGGKFYKDDHETKKVHIYSKEWNFLNSKYEAVYK